MVYDCLICGYGVAVTRHPSKLKSPVRTRLPALGSRYADSIERRQRKLSQRIKTSRQCPRNWCKSSNFLHSHRPSKRTGLTVNQRLVGAVPTMGACPNSSKAERFVYTENVGGSSPSSGTLLKRILVL